MPSPAPRRRVMEPRPRPAALPGWFRKFLTVSERRTAKLGRLRRCGAAAEALCGERGCPRRHHVAGPRGGEQANGEHLQSECGAGRDRRFAAGRGGSRDRQAAVGVKGGGGGSASPQGRAGGGRRAGWAGSAERERASPYPRFMSNLAHPSAPEPAR